MSICLFCPLRFNVENRALRFFYRLSQDFFTLSPSFPPSASFFYLPLGGRRWRKFDSSPFCFPLMLCFAIFCFLFFLPSFQSRLAERPPIVYFIFLRPDITGHAALRSPTSDQPLGCSARPPLVTLPPPPNRVLRFIPSWIARYREKRSVSVGFFFSPPPTIVTCSNLRFYSFIFSSYFFFPACLNCLCGVLPSLLLPLRAFSPRKIPRGQRLVFWLFCQGTLPRFVPLVDLVSLDSRYFFFPFALSGSKFLFRG